MSEFLRLCHKVPLDCIPRGPFFPVNLEKYRISMEHCCWQICMLVPWNYDIFCEIRNDFNWRLLSSRPLYKVQNMHEIRC